MKLDTAFKFGFQLDGGRRYRTQRRKTQATGLDDSCKYFSPLQVDQTSHFFTKVSHILLLRPQPSSARYLSRCELCLLRSDRNSTHQHCPVKTPTIHEMGSYQTLLPKGLVPTSDANLVSPLSQKVVTSASRTTSNDVKSVMASAITAGTPPTRALSDINASCLSSVPDIAKEALRITKESLGSDFQLVPRGMLVTHGRQWFLPIMDLTPHLLVLS